MNSEYYPNSPWKLTKELNISQCIHHANIDYIVYQFWINFIMLKSQKYLG